jgi:DNA-binding transcriptional ArsR family regulator
MTPGERQRLSMKAEIFKAMGQPTRLRILELIEAKEMQSGIIAVQVGTEAPNISKHLSTLRDQGLIVERKEGARVFYRGAIPQLTEFIWCVEKAVQERMAAETARHAPGSRIAD